MTPSSPVDSIAKAMEGDMSVPLNAIDRLRMLVGGVNTHNFDMHDADWVLDAFETLLPLARQAEAMKRELAKLREVRDHGREAAGTLHDALMAERSANAELRALLSRAEEYIIDGVTNAKADAEMNAAYPTRATRYNAALEEVRQLHADVSRALIGGGNAED